MKTKNLYNYMQARAEFEGVEFSLTKKFFESHFQGGVRTFFGIVLDNNGKLLTDNRQPEFFKKYKNK